MSALENFKEKIKEFKPTSWSINNKTSIYLLMLFVSMAGIFAVYHAAEGAVPGHRDSYHLCSNNIRR